MIAMRTPRTKLSPAVFGFFIAAFVLFATYFMWTASQTKHWTRESIVELQAAFNEVSLPPGAALLGEINSSSKTTTQAVYADFTMRATPDQVISTYQPILQSTGWTLVGNRTAPRENRWVEYCRGDMTITVETIEQKGPSVRYYFGVTRHQGPNMTTGCR